MNFKNFTDDKLLETTDGFISFESKNLISILHCFKEVDRRRLYSKLGYKSLFDFGVGRYKYSEDQCYRRISAMKLIKDIPEIEGKIITGELNLKTINLAQTYFKREEKAQNELSSSEKSEVLEQISSKSTREVERVLLARSTNLEKAKPDRIRNVASDKIELKITASNELQTKLEKLKGLIAHKYPDISLGKLIEKMVDDCLENWVKSAPVRKRRVIKVSKAQIRRDVFLKARNACEICKSNYALEVDHITPRAHGGSDESENLRLLCRSCNQRAAIEKLGTGKMDVFIN